MRGSSYRLRPGKMTPPQLKTAPGGAPTPVTPRPTPPRCDRKGGAMTIPGSCDSSRADLPTDSTAIAVTIGHLDFSPRCEGRRHKVDPPPADFLVDLHGCVQKFGCAGCVQLDRDNFAHLHEVGAQCERCRLWFYEFSRAITKVVPL